MGTRQKEIASPSSPDSPPAVVANASTRSPPPAFQGWRRKRGGRWWISHLSAVAVYVAGESVGAWAGPAGAGRAAEKLAEILAAQAAGGTGT